MRIRTRNNLIEFIENNAPTKSIFRAVLNHNENLGGFRRFDWQLGGGWIVRVTSKHNRQWLLAIHFNENTFSGYLIWVISKVPWQYWEGDKSENPLYQGDDPITYKYLRDKEMI